MRKKESYFFICNSLYNLSLVGQTDFIVLVSIIGVGILGKVAVIDHNRNLAFVDHHEEVDNDQDNHLVRKQLVLEVDLVVEDQHWKPVHQVLDHMMGHMLMMEGNRLDHIHFVHIRRMAHSQNIEPEADHWVEKPVQNWGKDLADLVVDTTVVILEEEVEEVQVQLEVDHDHNLVDLGKIGIDYNHHILVQEVD